MEQAIKPQSGKAYIVLKIDELTRVGDMNLPEKYYRIRYKTAKGILLTEDIDEANFTEAKVNEILIKKANEADKIKAL